MLLWTQEAQNRSAYSSPSGAAEKAVATAAASVMSWGVKASAAGTGGLARVSRWAMHIGPNTESLHRARASGTPAAPRPATTSAALNRHSP